MKRLRMLSLLRRWFINKYFFTLTLFALILTFCGDHSLIHRVQNQRKIAQLEQDIQNYDEAIQTNKRKINELQSNQQNLEKFAREQYHMKTDNEDIYLIKE